MNNFFIKILITTLFFVLPTILFSQTINNPETDDPDFYYSIGEFKVEVEQGKVVHVLGYVRRMIILNDFEYQKKQEEKTIIEPNKYRFELVLISKSQYEYELTSSWVYGLNIFVNNIDVVKQEYPNDDFNVVVKTTPTVLYWNETNEEMILIEINWNNVIYDPKKVK